MLDVEQALQSNFEAVDFLDFYRDIFPIGSFEERGVYEHGRYNGIAVCIGKGAKRAKRLTVTDDLDAIGDMVASDDFCLMSPISYAGKSRKSSNARYMYALALDLDGIEGLQQWQCLMRQISIAEEAVSFNWSLPRPTYLVSSGTGVHLYYVFEKPIPMFANIVEQLEKLKRRLTWQAWTHGASVLTDKVQYESLFQGFRVVGTVTKNGGRCCAFRAGAKVTLEYLNSFVPEEYRVLDFAYKSDLRLSEAKEKYPDWYQRRIIDKCPKQTWVCKRDLYEWWKRRLSEEAEQGHRYWCIMTLATYARKCAISRDELEEDAYGLIPLLDARGDPFTEDDVLHALEAYADSYITYPIDTIVARTGIQIVKNKRNWRKQKQHLQFARGVRQLKATMGENVSGGGRPDKAEEVRQWRSIHPDGTKAQCIRETGLSKPTVYRWWESGISVFTAPFVRSEYDGEEKDRKSYAEVVGWGTWNDPL